MLFCAVQPPSYQVHTAVVGQSYTIPCHTTVIADVRWFFKSTSTGFWYVYDSGNAWQEDSVPRFSFNSSVYGLDIVNVQLNDSGNYTCVDNVGHGQQHNHYLIVQRKTLYAAYVIMRN